VANSNGVQLGSRAQYIPTQNKAALMAAVALQPVAFYWTVGWWLAEVQTLD
jgi:hypothetical protein